MGIKGEKVEDWYSKEQASRANATPLKPSELKIGNEVFKNSLNGGTDGRYIITDILGDGKFKAIPKNSLKEVSKMGENDIVGQTIKINGKEYGYPPNFLETFDISTKKSPGQQAIKITPEIKALVKGEAPKLKSASGKLLEKSQTK